MFVRTAGERDLAAVRALLVETWHATYDAIYGAERVTAITDDWHSMRSLKARLTRPRSEFLVADDGKQLGGMAFAAAGEDGKILMLHQLYVRPAHQGHGVGGMLLDEILELVPGGRDLPARGRGGQYASGGVLRGLRLHACRAHGKLRWRAVGNSGAGHGAPARRAARLAVRGFICRPCLRRRGTP